MLGAVLLFLAWPTLRFLLPGTIDDTVESVEPLQTLRFFKTLGGVYDPWGPVPHVLFALPYAALLGYWRLSGDFPQASSNYPYGLVRPHEQLGDLIFSARWVGLLVLLISLLWLHRSMIRATGSVLGCTLAVGLCCLASPEVLIALSSSKPDTLMLAFLAAALGSYLRIVTEGGTRGRWVGLGVLSTLSISCKELTAPVLSVMYLSAMVLAPRPAPPTNERNSPGKDMVLGILAALLVYALLNIVYAPVVWWERMQVVLFGKLVDAEIWAAPDQTVSTYLRDSFAGVAKTLGTLSCLALLLAAIRLRSMGARLALAAWLPLVGHTLAVVVIAGYMPSYFLLPLTVVAALPVAFAFRGAPKPGAQGMLWIGVAGAALCLAWISAWRYMQEHRAWHPALLTEQYASSQAPEHVTYRVHLWGNHPGSSRLAYMGLKTDERALVDVLQDSEHRPDSIVVDRAHWTWVQDLKRRPRRVEMVNEESGHDYSGGIDLAASGYQEMTPVVAHAPPAWLTALQPRCEDLTGNPLLVFRRSAATVGQ